MVQETVHVRFLKIQLPGVVGKRDGFMADELPPAFQGLEGDAAVQNDVRTKVGDHIQAENVMIKLPALFHVLDGNQSRCVFHSCLQN